MNENDLKLLLTKFLVDGNLRLIKQQLFWNDIVEYTSFLDKAAPRQRIWHVFNGTKKPLCLVCGANVNFFGKNYSKVCSVRCAGKCDEIKQKYKNTIQNKYRVEVKSAYTAAPPFQPTINAKIKACQTAGYNVRLMIIDKKTGNCLNSYFESSVI